MILIYIQFALFFIYTFFVVRKYGVQRSISESWYTVEKPYKWMFTLVFCYGIGILQAFHGSAWFFMSGAFLCFVGAAMDFKGWETTKWVHNIGAVGCIVLALIGLAVTGIWWPFIPVAAAGVTLPKTKNGTWWIECVAFFSILGGLIQKYL
jgi:hypothetical protein